MKSSPKINSPLLAIIFAFCALAAQNNLSMASIIQIDESALPESKELRPNEGKNIPRNTWIVEQHLRTGNFESAIVFANQILEMDKENAEAHALLAAAYKGLGNETQFKHEVSLFKKLAPDSSALHMALANAYIGMKKFSDAEKSYKEGVAIAVDKTAFYFALGDLYLKTGSPKAAASQYQMLLREKGLTISDFIKANYALCRIGLQTKDYDAVIKRARMMIDLYPPLEQSYHFLAHAHMGKDDPGGAIAAYELLRTNNSASPVPLQELPLIYLDKLNDKNNALSIARQGVEQFPDNAKSQDVLGWVLYQAGQLKAALASLEKALQMAPEHPFYLYHLGLVLQELNEKSKALPVFEKALGLVDHESQSAFYKELEQRIEQCRQ